MGYDWIGWLATGIFVISYFCKQSVSLRRVQGLAALAWASYGVAIHALPVIVANVIVATVAVWTSLGRAGAVGVYRHASVGTSAGGSSDSR